jgi:diaminohydroxyphosphoribosylaminopyrimidine deaminase/5-amino-6-(5-phosphoribosylamino)uracil reductase
VEGGGRLVGAFVAAGCWQRFALYTAPVFLGDGPGIVGPLRFAEVGDAPRARVEARRRLGDDLLTLLRPA